MIRINFLSAENGTWNIKTAANQHTEAAINPLAVNGIMVLYQIRDRTVRFSRFPVACL